MTLLASMMTSNPICCLPSDSVMLAACAMKNNAVGAIPVIEDHNSRKLIGIITDRDITTRVSAEGHDPTKTKVSEVMTSDPITCAPTDALSTCEFLMEKHQVRRIPIVDRNGRCTGIVAQADVARHAGAVSVKKVLEGISQPVAVAQPTVA